LYNKEALYRTATYRLYLASTLRAPLGRCSRWKKLFLFILLTLLLLVFNWFAVFVFGFSLTLERWILLVLALLLIALLVYTAPRLSVIAWLFPGLLILLALFLTTSFYPVGQPAWMPMWVYWTWNLLPTALPALAIVFSAILTYSVLRSLLPAQEQGPAIASGSPVRRPIAARWRVIALLLATCLILKAFHNLYWVTVWDDTTDSIGYAFAFLPIIGSLYAGILIFSFLQSRGKWVGVLYLVLLPSMVIAVSNLAQRVDYRQFTVQRAARVNRAIQAYHSTYGHYPTALPQLVPRYLLSIPGPVIIIGQDWCYQSRADAYQFGYVTHQNWWTPYVSAVPVASHGDLSVFGPLCAAEIAAIYAANPPPP
jgi:hypothetical protein